MNLINGVTPEEGENVMSEAYEVKGTGPITIKDISARLNVSATSVHRALSGKEGVGEKLRRQILDTAKEMGYEINYAASSIKRATRHIAAVLPENDGLYFDYIWKGFRTMAKEVKGLNIEIEEFPCRDEQNQYELLKLIADAGNEEYAGVVTFSYTRSPKVLFQLQRMVAQKIVTIVIDDELKEPEGLYCIPPNEKVLGRVAGELIDLISPKTGTLLVSEGRPDSKIHINKIGGLTEFLREAGSRLSVQIVKGYSNRHEKDEVIDQALKEALRQYPDVVTCYALTSHDNALIVKAVKDMGLMNRISIIGTDLSETTAQFLRNGEMKAVINQGAYMKGYTGLSILVDSIVKHMEPPQRVDCPIDIVLKSNLSFYESSNQIKTWR